MSAPQTNIEKQQRRHVGPLVGITACLIFAGVIYLAFTFFMAGEPGEGEADVVPSPDVTTQSDS